MKRSESIKEIAGAQAKAQAKVKNAAKAAENPGFRRGNKSSKYADLAAIWDACREALSENGIAVFQTPSVGPNDKGASVVTVTTLLAHASGEWIESDLSAPAAAATPQAIGSAITYLRRYSLAAMVGVAPEDDDGNAASGVDADAGRPEGHEEPTKPQSRAAGLKEKVAAANGHRPDPIVAFKESALKEATEILGDVAQAKAWICGVREDPKAARPWTDEDCLKITASLALLRAKANQNGSDEWGLNQEQP